MHDKISINGHEFYLVPIDEYSHNGEACHRFPNTDARREARKQWGTYLREWRLSKHLTTKQATNLLQVGERSINNWEGERSLAMPSVEARVRAIIEANR